MSLFKKISIAAVALILLVVALGYVFQIQIRTLALSYYAEGAKERYWAQDPTKTLESLWPTITEDIAALEKYPFFRKTSQGQSDAGPFLTPLVRWDNNPSQLDLSEPLREKLKALNEVQDFSNFQMNWNQSPLDFAWMGRLHQFDHWGYDLYGPQYEEDKPHKLYSAPFLDYSLLSQWGRLRFFKGRDEGQLLAAFKDIRKLAELLYTHDNLAGVMTALALLRTERLAYESLDAAAQKTLPWQPITLEDYERGKRFFWAQPSFLDLRFTDEFFQKTSKIPVGLCLRVSEAIYTSIAGRLLLQADYPTAFARLEKLVKDTQPTCRNSFIRKAWNNPDFNGLFEKDQDVYTMFKFLDDGEQKQTSFSSYGAVPFKDLDQHPKLKSALGHILAELAHPNYLNLYQQTQSDE